MRTEQSYPNPIHGVSTLAPRTRPKGYASRQVNFRSDPVNKLTRRPSSVYRGIVTKITDPRQVQYHSYERGGDEFSFILDSARNKLYCTVNDVVRNTISLGTYGGSNMGLFTIEHDTYLLNRDIEVKLLNDTDEDSIEKVSHINVLSALNYGETIQVNTISTSGTKNSVSYTIPELGTENPDYDAADTARATKQVALSLANKLNALSGIKAVALSSCVAVYETNKEEWLQVEVESGQGSKSAVAVNQIIESTDGLPLYAVVGTRITIRPNPTSDKGTYYLQAERISDVATGEVLEEVVWSENRNPTQKHSIDSSTLPHKIEYDGTDFLYAPVDYRPRKTGDEDSTPFPEFVGHTIQSLGYFQKRLVVVAENAVYMTETEDLRNWFRQSAVQLLVTDPIGVTTSELGSDVILHLVPHNRDLLVITSNSQFKISGAEALTPQTVSMPLTTKYECQVSVAPTTIGNSVYFPVDYGDSTGVQEYTGERNTSQDFAAPITNHVIGYLQGKATLFAASPNLEMLAMKTDDGAGNKLFVYEQYTDKSGKRSQQSWSEWVFAEGEVIVDIKFRRNELVLLTARSGKLFVKAVPMYTRVTTSPLEVFLDDMLSMSTEGSAIQLPIGYEVDDCIVVRGAGTKEELWEVGYTKIGRILEFDEDIGKGTVYVGRKFTSTFEPTRPFIYDEDGSTITTDKLRVSRWIVSLVNTHELTMLKESKFTDNASVKFESRFVGDYGLGSVGAYTGDYKFSFSDDASTATATFYTDNHLGCTISDISWEGQYYKTKKRI